MRTNKHIVRFPDGEIPLALGGLPPLLARIYAHRGITDGASCQHPLGALATPSGLGGIDRAAALLVEAVSGDRRIVIVGDFDADGATASALAVRALRAMGARQVSYLVPDRFRFGYGLTPEIVAVACGMKPDLIITVDNGVSSIEGVAAARRAGIRVLITDHHLPGARLPEADAIVNPNLLGDAFPSKHLAGVGVIFYVLAALRRLLADVGWFARCGIDPPALACYLDLVALGTVADVVTLDHNNRVLVEQGLKRIRAGRCCAGVTALLSLGGRNPERAIASDLAFAVGPRLNAAGRLTDMSLGIECLLADDPARARELALRLDELNRERRAIETEMQADAIAALDALEGLGAEDAGICLYDPGWHIGVIGILASRIKDRLHRPVIAFAPDQSGELRGSARSIPGVHIRDVLDSIAAAYPGLLNRFGGHAMAAGLSLPADHLERFRAAFDEAVRRFGSFEPVLMSDGELAAEELNLKTAELLRHSGPWGQGFPEPLFDGRYQIVSRRIVGERHMRFMLRRADHPMPIEAIAFNCEYGANEPEAVQIAFRLGINEYNGLLKSQVVVEHIEAAPRITDL